MAILGLLLLLASAGLAVDVALRNTSSVSVDALGATFSLSPGWLFVAGVATGALGLLGLTMLLAGMTRARRRRAALADSRNNLQGLQAERDRLAVELERERAGRTSATAGTARHDGRLERDDESVIDLGDERRSGRTDDDYVVARTDDEQVEPGRHGLFNRRH